MVRTAGQTCSCELQVKGVCGVCVIGRPLRRLLVGGQRAHGAHDVVDEGHGVGGRGGGCDSEGVGRVPHGGGDAGRGGGELGRCRAEGGAVAAGRAGEVHLRARGRVLGAGHAERLRPHAGGGVVGRRGRGVDAGRAGVGRARGRVGRGVDAGGLKDGGEGGVGPLGQRRGEGAGGREDAGREGTGGGEDAGREGRHRRGRARGRLADRGKRPPQRAGVDSPAVALGARLLRLHGHEEGREEQRGLRGRGELAGREVSGRELAVRTGLGHRLGVDVGAQVGVLQACRADLEALVGVLEPVRVYQHVKAARAQRAELSHHDVLRDATESVTDGKGGRVQENFQRFLEGALDQGAPVDPVDAVSGDAHQVALVRHDVAEEGQVAVVDVAAVEADDCAQLAEQRAPGGLDAQHVEDFGDVVGDGFRVADLRYGQDLFQVAAVGIQHPVVAALELPLGLVVGRHGFFAHVDLGDAGDAAERDVAEVLGHELLQEDVLRGRRGVGLRGARL